MSGSGQNRVDQDREGCTKEMTVETGFARPAGAGIGMSKEDKGLGFELQTHNLTFILPGLLRGRCPYPHFSDWKADSEFKTLPQDIFIIQ